MHGSETVGLRMRECEPLNAWGLEQSAARRGNAEVAATASAKTSSSAWMLRGTPLTYDKSYSALF